MLLVLGRLLIVYFVGAIAIATIMTFTKAGPGPAWFFRLKLWQRLAFMGSLVLSCILGVWIIASQAQRDEWTLEPGATPWPSTPIRVWSGDGYAEEVRASIVVMNRSVGCELFREEGTQAAGQVRVRGFDGMPCGKPFRELKGFDPKKDAEGTWDCLDGTMEVLLNNPGDFDTAFRGALHGLGHTVRLEHDPSGVMAEGIGPLTILGLNDKDATALRERYCPATAR